MQIEQNLFRAVAGESGCRLVNNITPVGSDVKDGGVVQLALDMPAAAVLLGHTLGKVDELEQKNCNQFPNDRQDVGKNLESPDLIQGGRQ